MTDPTHYATVLLLLLPGVLVSLALRRLFRADTDARREDRRLVETYLGPAAASAPAAPADPDHPADPDQPADPDHQLNVLLVSAYTFGLQRSRSYQTMALVTGSVGALLMYYGTAVSLGLPSFGGPSARSYVSGALSAVGSVAIGLVTTTFLRESRRAHSDLMKQTLDLEQHLTQVRRERRGLHLLEHLVTSPADRSATGAEISRHLIIGPPAAAVAAVAAPDGRGTTPGEPPPPSGAAAPHTVTLPDESRPAHDPHPRG